MVVSRNTDGGAILYPQRKDTERERNRNRKRERERASERERRERERERERLESSEERRYCSLIRVYVLFEV